MSDHEEAKPVLVIKVTVLDNDRCIVDQDTFVPAPSPDEWCEQRRQLALAMKSLLDIMHNGSKQCPFSPERDLKVSHK